MKTFFPVALSSLLVATCAFGESAHKGWRATPYQWPSGSGSTHSTEQDGDTPIKSFRMQGPFVGIGAPNPPAQTSFKGEYWFRRDCTVTVQKVYMLLLGEDGTINTREIKTTPLNVNTHITTDCYATSFSTEEISFKEGDTFVVVFKINGAPTMVFLRVFFCPFEPS
ncbi:MAG TPA: hypothetical protein VMY37_16420 [Thermoguttaceae bacterium]|nr:hypothetical protein [Thermoguttaceae bacterium]